MVRLITPAVLLAGVVLGWQGFGPLGGLFGLVVAYLGHRLVLARLLGLRVVHGDPSRRGARL